MISQGNGIVISKYSLFYSFIVQQLKVLIQMAICSFSLKSKNLKLLNFTVNK